MKTKTRSQFVMGVPGIALVLALMACGLPAAGGAPTPTLIALPTTAGAGSASSAPTVAPPAQDAGSSAATKVFVGTSGAGAPLDLCALATPDEVKAVLGGPPARTIWSEGGQDCIMALDDTHLFIVQAGHDADGKTLHLGGMESQRGNIKDQSALQLLDQVKAQEPSLTLPELVRMGLPVWRAAGFNAEEETGVGDWSVWFYGTLSGMGTLGELGAGRASGAWLGVYLTTTDEAAAKAALKPLAITLLSRLPDDFTPTGQSK